MLLRLWKYIKGSVCIAVKGFSKERFINLLCANNIFVWDMTQKRNEFHLRMSINGYKRIRPLLRKTGCRSRILSKDGLPFLIHKYRRRILFAGGFAAFFLIIYFMSCFIWLIEINGNIDVSDAEILRYLESRGVYVGAPVKNIDTNKLKEELRENFPQIAWISLTQNGTRLLAEISENVKSTDRLDYSLPCDIISKRDCVITDIIAQSGTPKVKVGDTVKKGDVLISAVFDMPDENGEIAALPPAHSCGEVRGSWKDGFTVEIPFEQRVKKYTGKSEVLYAAKIFGKTFSLNFIKKGTKFKKYDTIYKSKQIGFSPDFPLPAVLCKTMFYEYGEESITLTEAEAMQQAQIMINKKMLAEFSDSCEITEKQIQTVRDKNKLKVSVKFTVEDNIGQEEYNINGTDQTADR